MSIRGDRVKFLVKLVSDYRLFSERTNTDSGFRPRKGTSGRSRKHPPDPGIKADDSLVRAREIHATADRNPLHDDYDDDRDEGDLRDEQGPETTKVWLFAAMVFGFIWPIPLSSSSFSGKWQANPHPRALSGRALSLNRATVPRDQPSRNRQPETGPARICRLGKPVKNVRQHVGRYSGAVVRDDNLDHARIQFPGDLNRTARRRMAKRVDDEVLNDLSDPDRIHCHFAIDPNLGC